MKNRMTHVDLLKIVATFSVVFLHAAAGNWGNVSLGTFEWNVFNFYDSVARFGVPIFVMSSGMFLLNPNKNITIKDIYYRYCSRIIIALVSWSLLYAVYINIINSNEFNSETFVKSIIFGHYHLWYLYMIMGLYVITPILRKVVQDKKTTEYFLLFSFVFTFFIPIVVKSLELEYLDIFIKKFQINFTFGYVGYYIGGYYFNTYDLKKVIRNIIYGLGVLGIILTYVFTNIMSYKTGMADSTFYSNFSPNVMIVSLAVFIFFKYEVSNIKFNQSMKKLISMISDCSFGIYLVHDFFNIFLANAGFNTLSYNPILSVPFAALVVFVSSFIASFLISKTPVLNRIV